MQLFKALDRIVRIHDLIHRESTGSPDQFAAKLHLKRRQLYYVLEEFRSRGAIIKYSRSRSSYYYENKFKITIEIIVKSIC